VPLKNNWANGDTFTPAAANEIANTVNAFGTPTATGQAVITAVNAAAARAAIGASSSISVEVSVGIPVVGDEKHTVCDENENASWLGFTATGGIPWRTRLLIAQATGRTITSTDDPTAYVPAGFGFLRWERLAVDGSEVIDILEGVF